MNLREVVSAFRREAIEESRRGGSNQDLVRLRVAAGDMRSSSAGIGRMPPNPGTPRGKAGAYLVRLVRRMLFWYTPQIVRFNEAATAFAAQTCVTLEKLSAPQDDTAFDVFVSEYRQNHPLPDRDLVFAELREALMQSGIAPGLWLDIECGSGQWLQFIRTDLCPDIRAVEPNSAEAALCEASGLKPNVMDPLRFLSGEPAGSFAVITALRVAERHPMPWNLDLIRQCARCLAPGGTLLLTGAEGGSDIPKDPCRVSPAPLPVLRAMLEHAGFRNPDVRYLPRGEYFLLARRP